MIEKLIQLIGQREIEYIHEPLHTSDDITCSSFYPFEYPENVSHRIGQLETWNSESHCCRQPPEIRFLPCHYFDYICGSSTGA